MLSEEDFRNGCEVLVNVKDPLIKILNSGGVQRRDGGGLQVEVQSMRLLKVKGMKEIALVMSVRYLGPHCECSADAQTAEFEEEEEEELSLDCVTANHAGPSSQRFQGELHVVYDDVYECPSLLTRVWHVSGTMATKVELQSLSKSSPAAAATLCEEDTAVLSRDERSYHFGDLEPVAHPLLGDFWWGYHLCEMSAFFQQMISQSSSHTPSASTYSPAQMIVSFLFFAGRYVGLSIGPKSFAEIQEMIASPVGPST